MDDITRVKALSDLEKDTLLRDALVVLAQLRDHATHTEQMFASIAITAINQLVEHY